MRVDLLWLLATNSFRTDQLDEITAAILNERRHWTSGSVEDTCLTIGLGNIDRLKADFGPAARHLYVAYQTSEGPEKRHQHIEAARLLARLMGDVHNIPAALDFNDEVIKYESANDQTFMLGLGHGFRGIYLNDAARYREAIVELETAIQTAGEFDDKVGRAYINQQICRAYVGLANWDLAKPHCLSSREYLYSQGEDGYFQTDTLLAEIDLAQGKPDAALKRLNAVIDGGSGTTSISQFEQYRLRSQANRGLGNTSDALSDLSRYVELSDKWEKSASDRRLIVMHERYLADLQMEQSRKLEQALAAERQAADQRKMLYLSVIASGLMAIVFLLYVYANERRKHRLSAEIANTDMLTGISNRRRIEHILKVVHEDASIGSTEYCVAIIDIDHFKSINDTYGHSVGDQVLRDFARMVSEKLAPDDFVGRWGGEEFLVVFTNKNEQQSLAELEFLRNLVSRECSVGNSSTTMRFSAGISANRAATRTIEETIRQADLALYQAKTGGRNKICLFNAHSTPEKISS